MPSARITLVSLMLLCAHTSHAIMVKFGTSGGPIVPPASTTVQPPSKPYRNPAPVWEERENDTPDPNANWRPQKFVPQGLHTSIAFNQPQNNAQRFVNSYLPRQPQPVAASPITNYFTPTQIVSELSSQNLPGYGIRYFVPAFVNGPHVPNYNELKNQEESKLNDLETNEVDVDTYAEDLKWKYEKEAAKRVTRHSHEGTYQQVYQHQPVRPYVYQWPAYVARQQ